ncbi:MAG: DUF4292 domain-containing protein [Bacteroidota bacterium]|nr:DUF4292 domain-containing protein [Bacteroidota bacterium]
MWNRLVILSILVLSTMATSCKSRKKKNIPPPVVTQSIDSTQMISKAVSLLLPTLFDWKYFSSKMSISYQNGSDKKSFDANVRMYKDSLIWLSASMFGIEGGRVLINPDSAVLMNKLERNYMVYKKDMAKGFIDVPLDVKQLQNLLLARPIFELNNYRLMDLPPTTIEFLQKQLNTSHHYNDNPLFIVLTKIQELKNNTNVQANYSNYLDINGRQFAQKLEINSKNNESTINIIIEFRNPDFQTELTFPLTIPSSYEKVK